MKITVTGNETKTIACGPGQSVLEALTKGGVYVSAVCGGGGRCGKCGVQLLQGHTEPTPEDKKIFTEEELEQGFRLSCTAYPTGDCTLRVLASGEEEFEVLAEAAASEETPKDTETACLAAGKQNALEHGETQNAVTAGETSGRCLIAVDIGTTTLALSLVALPEEADGRAAGACGEAAPLPHVVDTYTGVNHQRAYGADVISRIRAFDQGKGEEMTASVRRDLLAGIQTLLEHNHVDGTRIAKVVVAGNTTMGHLLLGYDCHGLGQVPFTPVSLDRVTVGFEELFQSRLLSAPVTVMPGFSAFVGGDIVSGLLYCKLYEAERPSLFIDLGTNGEMAIGNKEKLLVTSTAAGPAFEGGNISCGVGSIGGAIYGVHIDGGQARVRTVGDKPPIGICGTGVIEVTAELLRTELLDETGLLDEDYFDDGFVLGETAEGQAIAFTQKDIRELQLAKAAVRGGLETLLVRYGVSCEELEHVYVAGGFGVHLDMEKAVAIGLLPETLLGKIRAAGNTSLGGAAVYGQNPDAEEICRKMIQSAREVDLSTDKEFQEFYMDAMLFE